MLIDKGYYDYDFNSEAAEKRQKRDEAPRKRKDSREMESVLARFGFTTRLRGGADEPEAPMTAEEMQRIAMEESAAARSGRQP